MLLSGFTFIRNAKKYDFPFMECVASMLPIVDELVINVGKSEDGTEEYIASTFKSPKIRVVHSVWDDTQIKNGVILSEQTNIALEACKGRWALYLQGDEAIHEEDHREIREAVEREDKAADPVDGFRFRYLHFYGGYSLVQRPWNWYPSEIRVIRTNSGARSFGDAQTFHVPGRTGEESRRGAKDPDRGLRTRLLDAHVYHYGHAREPETMARKIHYFHRFWHGDNHGIDVRTGYDLDFKNLVWFWGSHPAPYGPRVKVGLDWSPRPDKLAPKLSNVVIDARGGDNALAEKLKLVVEKQLPQTAVVVVRTSREWKAALKAAAPAETSAIVDLAAESRGLVSFLSWIAATKRRFGWRVAHVPGGKLCPFRTRMYSVLSWGSHEQGDIGFRVPGEKHALQLARWLGISV